MEVYWGTGRVGGDWLHLLLLSSSFSSSSSSPSSSSSSSGPPPPPSSPVVIPYEVVVKELERDTVETSACLGYDGKRFVCGEFPSAVFISLKVSHHHDILLAMCVCMSTCMLSLSPPLPLPLPLPVPPPPLSLPLPLPPSPSLPPIRWRGRSMRAVFSGCSSSSTACSSLQTDSLLWPRRW